jgi:hypothetical protein
MTLSEAIERASLRKHRHNTAYASLHKQLQREVYGVSLWQRVKECFTVEREAR